MSAFQAEDKGSIPFTRTENKASNEVLFIARPSLNNPYQTLKIIEYIKIPHSRDFNAGNMYCGYYTRNIEDPVDRRGVDDSN